MSSKITKSAKDQPCIRCGASDGTISARHYNGLRQHSLGKGRGLKVHDIASAELCYDCDIDFTEGVNAIDDERAGKSIARSEEFLYLCVLTNIRRYKDGILK